MDSSGDFADDGRLHALYKLRVSFICVTYQSSMLRFASFVFCIEVRALIYCSFALLGNEGERSSEHRLVLLID